MPSALFPVDHAETKPCGCGERRCYVKVGQIYGDSPFAPAPDVTDQRSKKREKCHPVLCASHSQAAVRSAPPKARWDEIPGSRAK